LGDPEKVVSYWQMAQDQGFRPENGFEYIPFIEAYARLGNWERAFILTKTAKQITQAMYFILCPTWKGLEQGTPASPDKDAFVTKAYDLLMCAPE
jgi:hypothetical protein